MKRQTIGRSLVFSFVLVSGVNALWAVAAKAQVMEWLPVGANESNLIVANEIFISLDPVPGLPVRIDLELRISGWGALGLNGYLAELASIGMLGINASPAVGINLIHGSPPETYAFIDAFRLGYVFFAKDYLLSLDLTTPDYRYGSALITGCRADTGLQPCDQAYYAGTLSLFLPVPTLPPAGTTYTIGFGIPDSVLIDCLRHVV